MCSQNSISTWIAELKDGEAEAAQQLWERYATQLVELARQQLRDAPKGMADEEDVAQSVFWTLCRGAQNGRFQQLRKRDELWWLLLTITKHKAVDQIRQLETVRYEKDSGSEVFSLDQLVGDQPTPDFLVTLEEQNQRLLRQLRDDTLRRIALSRLAGYSVREIATDLSIGVRSVERKLQLIRSKWSKELEP